MRKRLALPLAACALITTACNGDDEITTSTTTVTAEPTASTTPPPSTTIPPATASPITTTAVPSSAATTAPTTSPPSTTVPPATTAPLTSMPDFTLDEVVAIDRDFREGFRRFYAALMYPNDEATAEAALTYTTGTDFETTNRIIERYRTGNRRIELLPSPAPSFFIEQGPSRVPEGGDVVLVLCEIAPYKIYEVGADGSDNPVTEVAMTQRIQINLRFEDGIWKRSEFFLDGQWEGAIQCPVS